MNDIATIDQPASGALSVAQVGQRIEAILELMRKHMKPGIDFGQIPGTNGQPSLLKPGMEKLAVLFQLDVQCVTAKTYLPDGHLIAETVCTVYHAPSGTRLGSASTVCSSKEAKYAYRGGARLCPVCGKACIKKSKFPPRGTNSTPGYYCYAKIGGCGTEFAHDCPEIVNQSEERQPNPDIADTYNTVIRMAEKRASVAAVRLVTGASAIFDDEYGPGEKEPEAEQHDCQPPSAPKKADNGRFERAAGAVGRWVESLNIVKSKEALSVLWNNSGEIRADLEKDGFTDLVKELQNAAANAEKRLA